MDINYDIAGAIIGGSGLIAAAIRWSANRIIKATDRNTDISMKQVETSAAMMAKMDVIIDWIQSLTPPMGSTKPRGKGETDPPVNPITATKKKTKTRPEGIPTGPYHFRKDTNRPPEDDEE